MATGSDALGLIGATIADKYVIESVVGEGGFATVYRATHVIWKRPVAVKVFKALGEVAEQERKKLLDDFIQEGALLADLSERSTAICQARDVGMTTTPRGEQVPYMVLEWLEGKPLEDVLQSERHASLPLRSLEETVRLLDPVAEALALAHKKGIAHRDVKPANIFVLGDPRGADVGVKLLDFGIAKVVQDAQRAGFGKTAGHITSFTPAYGAPEQFNRAYGATGPWTDVFALALVIVEVITGREPISGDTLVQLAYASSDPSVRPTPRALGAQVSDAVEALFQKALAVKPEDRHRSAGELWNALRTAVIGQPMASIVMTPSDSKLPVSSRRAAPRPEEIGDTALVLASAPVPVNPSPPVGTSASAPTNPPDRRAEAPAVKPHRAVPLLALGLGAVVIAGGIGAAFFASRAPADGGPGSGAASRHAASSASVPASSAVTAPPAATCPPGMKPIPGGEFYMGSDEKDAEPNEKPPHMVKLAPYCLDEHEVTVAKYKACSDRGACLRAAKENEWEGITPLHRKIYDPLCNVVDPVGRANHPVNCVNWEQART